MVKIPKFDELKKMGGDLAQTAKSGGLFDKLKSSMDSLATGGHDDSMTSSGDPVKDGISECRKLMDDLLEVQKIETNLMNNLKSAFSKLATECAKLSVEETSNAEEKAETSTPDQSESEENKNDI